ncbi:N-acetylmuramoyl-L-alanine amidase [Carnobacterium maltaromaticum LMA28]|uniref:N-acetylmuramoyl-L-alanine amidase n=1 Tax=Carnobacterium maltaromaticum LMA28 TaxID=1234679 RepID=K8E4Q6_CARML|nr:N-acetylmuramoyl-L-alanine amidase [Carnobacterium maltaromaticum]CCO11562.2 N-acetylmuramoyl-L-alanine amidase [Carnobacterium maltaromaticum LMA28]
MSNNVNSAFVSHWVGGGGRAVQIAPSGFIQWGAGPRANGRAYAQVELARTNNAETFKKRLCDLC